MNVTPVILCGGSGSRLWPLSRDTYPKQFLALTEKWSLLQATIVRAAKASSCPPVFVSNEAHRFLVAQQAQQTGCRWQDLILEPCARNTAPAIAAAAIRCMEKSPDAICLILPSDHVITDDVAFQRAVNVAVKAAQEDRMVAFGITPTAPATGYGYIRADRKLAEGDDQAVPVVQFVEKPNEVTAKEFIACGEYLWNSGMFVFKASVFLQELEAFSPQMLQCVRDAVAQGQGDLDFFRLNQAIFEQCPSDSIDYAVMEKTSKASVVPLSLAWSDVGSWDALWDVSVKDEMGNAFAGDVISHDTKNCVVKSTGRMVATVGVEDLVVVGAFAFVVGAVFVEFLYLLLQK